MLFASGMIPCLCWLQIQLGTYHRTHCHCQDLEPGPDELNELKQFSLDLCSDAELSPEEDEPDHEWCGEGDLGTSVLGWRAYCR